MALLKKKMAAVTLGTVADANLYTAPAAGAVVKEVTLVNKSAAAATVTVKINGMTFVPAVSLAAAGTKDAVLILALSTVMNNGDTITGSAGTAAAIDCTISGMEG